MRIKIQRWGNSLGLRIPKSFAQRAGVEAGSTVNLSIESGDLVVKPMQRRRHRLSDLLEGVTSGNIHHGVDTARQVGREIW